MSALADILTSRFGLEPEALSAAERTRAEKGGQLGEILIQQKAITEPQLLEALSQQLDLPFWPKLPLNDIDAELVSKIPIQFLKKHSLVPLSYRRPLTAQECGRFFSRGQVDRPARLDVRQIHQDRHTPQPAHQRHRRLVRRARFRRADDDARQDSQGQAHGGPHGR